MAGIRRRGGRGHVPAWVSRCLHYDFNCNHSLQIGTMGNGINEVSSFEEVRVQKKLAKEGKIEVMVNPTFMTEARRKELEGERSRESLFH